MTPTTIPVSTSTKSPLDIPELLELILLAPSILTIHDHLRTRQVSTPWRSCIDSSPQIQQRLHIFQLLELIFLAPTSLTIRDILRARQVSTLWRDCIDSSPQIQRRLHILPSKTQDFSLKPIDTVPSFFSPHHRHLTPSRGSCVSEQTFNFVIDFPGHEHLINDPVVRRQLRKHLVFQSAYQVSEIHVLMRRRDVRPVNLWWYSIQPPSEDGQQQRGLTLGDIVDAACAGVEKHAQCPGYAEGYTGCGRVAVVVVLVPRVEEEEVGVAVGEDVGVPPWFGVDDLRVEAHQCGEWISGKGASVREGAAVRDP